MEEIKSKDDNGMAPGFLVLFLPLVNNNESLLFGYVMQVVSHEICSLNPH